MKKHIAIVFILSTMVVQAQSIKKATESKPSINGVGKPQFSSTHFNFGAIEELKGSVEHTYEVENVGNGPLRIVNVLTSCGCTTPEWTRSTIQPGKKGYIRGIFDPRNRPGIFSKALSVFFEGYPNATFVYLEGEVLGANSGLFDIFPSKVGNVRFTKSVIDVKEIKETNIDTFYISAYNTSSNKVLIRSAYGTNRVKVENENNVLLPQSGQDISFIYNPKNGNEIGPVWDEVKLVTDDDSIPTKIITIRANIVQDFDSLTKDELKKAPVIILSQDSIDLGEVYLGEIKTYSLEITNKGKSDLNVRRVYGSCGCTAVSMVNHIVKKGKKANISIQFNAKGLRGNQRKTVTIISNDPNHSVIEVLVKAKVVIPGVDPIKN